MLTLEGINREVLYIVRFYTYPRRMVARERIDITIALHPDDFRDVEIASIDIQPEEYRDFCKDYCDFVYGGGNYLSIEEYYEQKYLPQFTQIEKTEVQIAQEEIAALLNEISERERRLKELRKNLNSLLK